MSSSTDPDYVEWDETVHDEALSVHKGDHLCPVDSLCFLKNHYNSNFFQHGVVPHRSVTLKYYIHLEIEDI